jgi:hypothetical protein
MSTPTHEILTNTCITGDLVVSGSITGGSTGSAFITPITTTDSTSSTTKDTGSLIVEGGAGIEENLYIGGTFNGITIDSKNAGATQSIVIGDSTTGVNISTSDDSVAIGNGALATLTAANSCIAIGNDTLNANTTGNSIAIGNNALLVQSNPSAPNMAIGNNAGSAITDGVRNICIGHITGDALVTADRNTLVGYASGGTLTGSDNTMIGQDSGTSVVGSDQCVFLGSETVGIASGNNQIAIGYGATTTAVNECVIGNSSLARIKPGGNDSCDLGESGTRFKDLYLSGNVTYNGSELNAATGGLAYASSGGRNVVVVGDYLYLIGSDNFYVIDISDKTADPVEVGSLTSTDLTTMTGLDVQGEWAVVISYSDNRLAKINISDPTSPTYSSSNSVVDGTNLDRVHALKVNGGVAYTATNNTTLTHQIIASWRLGVDGEAPVLLDALDLEALLTMPEMEANGMDISQNLLIVTGVYDILGTPKPFIVAVDITDPSALSSVTLHTSSMTSPRVCQIRGKYLYVCDTDSSTGSLDIYDASDPFTTNGISFVGGVALNDAGYVKLFGNYAAITTVDSTAQLYLVDISDPTTPSLKGSAQSLTGANSFGLDVVGNFAYTSTNTSLPEIEVFDLGGLTGSTAQIGNAKIDTLQVSQELQVVGPSSMRAGLSVAGGLTRL